jgi:hypothetical protein
VKYGFLDIHVEHVAGKLKLAVVGIPPNPMGVETLLTSAELRDLGHMLIREADTHTAQEA